MKKIIIYLIMIMNFNNIIAQDKNSNYIPPIPLPDKVLEINKNEDYAAPEIKESGEDIDGDELRYLERTYTVMMEAKVDLFIPLEVITDVDIETTIIGDQIKDIPFEIELNRKPEKENYYSIKYSETVLDMDQDGQPDTYINSPKFINEKVEKDNYIKIYGKNISKEGTHKKTVYITVEAGE